MHIVILLRFFPAPVLLLHLLQMRSKKREEDKQGDRMSLQINGPKCIPANVLSKLKHNFFREKKMPKNVGYSKSYPKKTITQ
jgi:hypothetical protein